MTHFPERQIVQLLLVRAAEEHASGLFTREQLAAATIAALDARDDAEVVEKRTAYLYLRLPKPLRNLAHVALLPEDLGGLCLALATVAGVLSNYVGPSGSIHVAYNPLSLLLVWNLVVLAALGLRRLRKPGLDETSGSWLSGAYLKWRAWRAGSKDAKTSAGDAAHVATAFLGSYRALASDIVGRRLRTLAHVGAIGILVGALVGTYIRGLFSEYDAIWRSTFLTTPDSVATFLDVVLGPASLLLHGRLLTPADVAPLLTPSGAPAAEWIHLLAITLGVIVVPARLALAVASYQGARDASSAIGIDLSEPYFANLIEEVREGVGTRLREGIATAFRLETAKLSEFVAVFVCESFFDRSVAPILMGFRNRGGRIADLEVEIREATERFEPALLERLGSAQRDLQRAVAVQVRAVIGREVQPSSEMLDFPSTQSLPLDGSVTESLASGLGDAVGATITTAVAAAVATISGGLGKSLGIAVLSALLGTSGPVGLLIGGAAGVALVGGAWLLGRDRITASIKTMSLPATLVSIGLRDAKIAEARQQTYSQIRRQIESELEPRIGPITDAILAELPRTIAAEPS